MTFGDIKKNVCANGIGWAGRIRTPVWQGQNLLPYRLATAQHYRNHCSRSQNIYVKKISGWAGRIRTPGWRDQNPLPYRLATAQSQISNGGEGGIRTLGGLLTHTRLAGVHLQPARSPLPKSGTRYKHLSGGG